MVGSFERLKRRIFLILNNITKKKNDRAFKENRETQMMLIDYESLKKFILLLLRYF